MGEKRYIISDASKQVDVEAHVLRYWEVELDLDVPRNEMGHRYYTDKHIKLLKDIKSLKERGFQLKAIKMVLPELIHSGGDKLSDQIFDLKEDLEITPVKTTMPIAENQPQAAVKMQQFETIMTNIISKVLIENNSLIGQEVSESVIKEMDYLMRLNDDKEDERYKKLDETIRSYQRSRMEAAVVSDKQKKQRKKSKFF
ncbi:MAG: MerR family transcriptional regulator [Clostridiales bacterium]|nr:MerR family transcriptional regulator [Clostridiales bacterium]